MYWSEVSVKHAVFLRVELRFTFHLRFSCPTSQMTNPSIVYADMTSGCPVLCWSESARPAGTLIQIIRLLFPQQWPWILEPKIAKITDMTYGVRKWEWHFYKLTRKLTEVNPEISRKCTKSRGQNRRKDSYKLHAQSLVVTQTVQLIFSSFVACIMTLKWF